MKNSQVTEILLKIKKETLQIKLFLVIISLITSIILVITFDNNITTKKFIRNIENERNEHHSN